MQQARTPLRRSSRLASGTPERTETGLCPLPPLPPLPSASEAVAKLPSARSQARTGAEFGGGF